MLCRTICLFVCLFVCLLRRSTRSVFMNHIQASTINASRHLHRNENFGSIRVKSSKKVFFEREKKWCVGQLGNCQLHFSPRTVVALNSNIIYTARQPSSSAAIVTVIRNGRQNHRFSISNRGRNSPHIDRRNRGRGRRSEFGYRQRQRFFFSTLHNIHSRPGSSLLFNGQRGLKQPGCKGDHSPPPRPKLKMYIVTPT